MAPAVSVVVAALLALPATAQFGAFSGLGNANPAAGTGMPGAFGGPGSNTPVGAGAGGFAAGALGGGMGGGLGGGLGSGALGGGSPLGGVGGLGPGALGSGALGGAGGTPFGGLGGLGGAGAGQAAQPTGFGATPLFGGGMGGGIGMPQGGQSAPPTLPPQPEEPPVPARMPGDPPTLHKAFQYSDIASHLLEKPRDRPVEECRAACQQNEACAAWEVCAPLGDGCDGCYLVKRAPKRFSERAGWHAEVLPGREELGWAGGSDDASNLTYEGCLEYLLDANGADQSQPFHEPAIMQKYTNCGFIVRDEEKPRAVGVNGQHWPTFLVSNFWDPPVKLPEEVEREMFANSGRQPRASPADQGVGILSQLHATVGTKPWEDHVQAKPRGPHAFVLPFYDTNIGHWMKQHGSMNPLQSYEMQSLLQAGDVALDVGANLGCYTVPFAERVGPQGKVLAFEPFRWLQQIVSANVAINGLSNVWVLPVGLSTELSRFEARPPQLRFFSSPGGVKLHSQQDGMKAEEAMQLYDWDSEPQLITTVSLDDLLITRSANSAMLGVPPVNNVRLIKIDVEGMEKEVIAGARQVIMRFKPIIWTENVAYFSSKGQDTSFLQLMDELEYACAQAQNAPNDIICTDRNGQGHQIA